MSDARPILRVGLTGGIASGKTTVAHIFAGFGALVLDADDLAHQAIEPGGAAYDDVLEAFGKGILDEDGRIVRSRLAREVFHDDEARRTLNEIVHPVVRGEFARRVEDYTADGHAAVAIFDAALLIETGMYRDFHRLIVISCSRQAQVRRLLTRDGLTADEAHARIAAQAPLEDKLALADYVIDTEKTLRETHHQAERVWTQLLNDFEQHFGPPRKGDRFI